MAAGIFLGWEDQENRVIKAIHPVRTEPFGARYTRGPTICILKHEATGPLVRLEKIKSRGMKPRELTLDLVTSKLACSSSLRKTKLNIANPQSLYSQRKQGRTERHNGERKVMDSPKLHAETKAGCRREEKLVAELR